MRGGSEKEQESLGPSKDVPESSGLYSEQGGASIRDRAEASKGEGRTKERRREALKES